MSRLLCISATGMECTQLASVLAPAAQFDDWDLAGWQGRVGCWDFTLLVSGPGMANAAMAAALGCRAVDPQLVVNIGVCGVYSNDAALLGTPVVGHAACFADTGVADAQGFTCLSDLPLPTGEGMPDAAVYRGMALQTEGFATDVQRGVFCTVASITGTADAARLMQTRWSGASDGLLCEDMESAAVSLVARRMGCACSVVRGISNRCGERDHRRWRLADAARAAQQILIARLAP